MQAANEYLATHTLDGSAHNLQEIEIPQQFADLGEWNEWVVGHFTSGQIQNAEQAANEYLSTHTLDGIAHNLQETEIPQQFADLGEWNEWVSGHFDEPEAKDADDAAQEFFATRNLASVTLA